MLQPYLPITKRLLLLTLLIRTDQRIQLKLLRVAHRACFMLGQYRGTTVCLSVCLAISKRPSFYVSVRLVDRVRGVMPLVGAARVSELSGCGKGVQGVEV